MIWKSFRKQIEKTSTLVGEYLQMGQCFVTELETADTINSYARFWEFPQ